MTEPTAADADAARILGSWTPPLPEPTTIELIEAVLDHLAEASRIIDMKLPDPESCRAAWQTTGRGLGTVNLQFAEVRRMLDSLSPVDPFDGDY